MDRHKISPVEDAAGLTFWFAFVGLFVVSLMLRRERRRRATASFVLYRLWPGAAGLCVGNIVKHRIRAILFDLGGVLIRLRSDYLPDPRLDRFESLICTHLDEDTARGKVLLELGFGREAFAFALVRLAGKYERDEILWRVVRIGSVLAKNGHFEQWLSGRTSRVRG